MRYTNLVRSWIRTKSDITIDSEGLYVINSMRRSIGLSGRSRRGIHTRSLDGNSGIVASFSIIFSVKHSTKLLKSFWD